MLRSFSSALKVGLFCLLSFVLVKGTAAQGIVSTQIDARAEVATVVYNASATLAAAEQAADEDIRELRNNVESLRDEVDKSTEENQQLQQQLTEAEEHFVATLEERDRTYARQITAFRNSIEDIASTPEGAAALAQYNAGNEIEAINILDDLRAANDNARAIRSAAEGRRIAVLALETRFKGKMTTEDVISRFEEITSLDPDVHNDWVELSRLYYDLGNLSMALSAAENAAEKASTAIEEANAYDEIGDILFAQNDLGAALTSYEEAFQIRKALSEAAPEDSERKGS